MKIKEELKKVDKLMIGIIISLLLMVASVMSLAFDYVKVYDIISWQTILLLFPFILFAVLMVIYDIQWDKKLENEQVNKI